MYNSMTARSGDLEAKIALSVVQRIEERHPYDFRVRYLIISAVAAAPVMGLLFRLFGLAELHLPPFIVGLSTLVCAALGYAVIYRSAIIIWRIQMSHHDAVVRKLGNRISWTDPR